MDTFSSIPNISESGWCMFSLDSNEQLLIGSIYCSPNSSVKKNSRHLVELINKAIELKYDYTVLVGILISQTLCGKIGPHPIISHILT